MGKLRFNVAELNNAKNAKMQAEGINVTSNTRYMGTFDVSNPSKNGARAILLTVDDEHEAEFVKQCKEMGLMTDKGDLTEMGKATMVEFVNVAVKNDIVANNGKAPFYLSYRAARDGNQNVRRTKTGQIVLDKNQPRMVIDNEAAQASRSLQLTSEEIAIAAGYSNASLDIDNYIETNPIGGLLKKTLENQIFLEDAGAEVGAKLSALDRLKLKMRQNVGATPNQAGVTT